MHGNGCCDFYLLVQSMRKRKAELPVVVDTSTTSGGHEARPSTVTGLNRYQSAGEAKADLGGDHREVSGRETLSVPGGSVHVTTSVVPTSLHMVTRMLQRGYPAVVDPPVEAGRPPRHQNRPLPRPRPGHTRIP